MSDKSDLIREYKKLAKRANARLLALEKLSKQEYFKVVKEWSYRKALYNIRQYGGDRRFKVNIPEDINIKTLSAMRNDVYTFLNSASSTKTSIINLYKEKAGTFNKYYGTDWDWREMAEYFEKGGRDIFEEKFSSSTALDVLGVFRKNKDDIKKAVKEFNEKNEVNDKDLSYLIDNLKDNYVINKKTGEKTTTKIIDWKMEEDIKELLFDKEFSIEKFL